MPLLLAAIGLVVTTLLVPAPARPQGQSIELPPQDVERLRAYHERLVETVRGADRRLSLADLMGPALALAAERSVNGSPADENRVAILAIAFYVNGRSLSVLTPEAESWPRAERRRVLLSNRGDLAQHCTISAALSAAAGAPVANLIGLYKEIDDARRGSGFSFVDLTADRAGTTFGRLATESPESARRLHARVGTELTERQMMPHLDGLPEGLSHDEFKRRFMGDGRAAYDDIVNEIDRRISALSLFQS
jgi:hypothetical protein